MNSPPPTSCCGHPGTRRDTEAILPDNPIVPDGIQIIYLGAGVRDLRGDQSGLLYHVSNHRRTITIASIDLDHFIADSDFMLKPS